jgi:hypothetical protein
MGHGHANAIVAYFKAAKQPFSKSIAGAFGTLVSNI